MERFEVKVTKDFLVFSAGHFITFDGGKCERIHGHNYRVEVEVEGPLDENAYVIDFLALRDLARGIVERLDHRMLLPDCSRWIAVTVAETQTTARFGDRWWSFPADECVILPIENTTTELLAKWFGEELRESLRGLGYSDFEAIRVRMEENVGQWAVWEFRQPKETVPVNREEVSDSSTSR